MGEDRDFTQFVSDMRKLTNIDLAAYKEAQMKRRLTSLRAKRGFATFAAYFAAMKQDQRLLAELLDRMTINVSEFWRNANRWETLSAEFIPELLRAGRPLRCWSAACSTGEEPYTVAMLLAEKHALQGAFILGTDIDRAALHKAAEAVYLPRSVREVPALLLKKYFRHEQSAYRLNGQLKQAVVFRKHNLLTDEIEHTFDLVICRNMLIYLKDEAKNIVYCKLSAALRPGGILFIGSTEQIFAPSRFHLEPNGSFFYRKQADV